MMLPKIYMELRQLEDIIKGKEALRALAHVIIRAHSFNTGMFPLVITSVGISGSSLREVEVEDIDVILECSMKSELMSEWRDFKRKLSENFNKIWSFITEVSTLTGRATINHIIENFRDELIDLGFKDLWINEWFPWMRVSDFRRGIEKGLPIPYFDVKDLVSRYVKYGWRGKRLEVHVVIEGEASLIKIPYVRVWTNKEGVIVPDNKVLKKYFIDERKELITLSMNIIKGSWAELPPAYFNIKSALESTFEETTLISNAIKPYVLKSKEIHDKVKKMLLNEIKELEKLVKESPKEDITELMEYNTALSKKLKRMLVHAYIINTVKRYDIIIKIAGKAHVKDINSYVNELRKYIIRNAAYQGLRRKILREILQNVS
ncbi:MAG: hypothetical protein B6U85_10610 [Desulfurococcales archaeon ex4484_42]|nr:MAG: hypothetical protein B6U85_10610 [Desulfurococcales archaeon ex4484_42]